MLVYIILFAIPAIMAFLYPRSNIKTGFLVWLLMALLLILIIGLRYEVGGDWSNYIRHFELIKGLSLVEALGKSDPGHGLLNWLMVQIDGEIYSVNLIYAILFTYALIKFSSNQTNAWLALTVSIPYLVIVVFMGYTRQSAAISFFMLAILQLNNDNLKGYIIRLFFAILFHKTAVLLIAFGTFLKKKGKLISILMILPIAYGLWDLFLSQQQERLWHYYVERQSFQSQGAILRILMNAAPAILLFIFRKRWKQYFSDYEFWYWIALGSILSVFLVNFASTAVDRVGLYFIPIQIVVMSRLPFLMKNWVKPQVTTAVILLGYFSIMMIWLIYAPHAHEWVPYKNILLETIF